MANFTGHGEKKTSGLLQVSSEQQNENEQVRYNWPAIFLYAVLCIVCAYTVIREFIEPMYKRRTMYEQNQQKTKK